MPRIIITEKDKRVYKVELVENGLENCGGKEEICYISEELKDPKKTEEMVEDLLEKYRSVTNYVVGDIEKIKNTIQMAECLSKVGFKYLRSCSTVEKQIEKYIKEEYTYAEEGVKSIKNMYEELKRARIIRNEMKISEMKEMIVKLEMKNKKGQELYSKRWQHEGVRHGAGLRIKPRVQESDSENDSDKE